MPSAIDPTCVADGPFRLWVLYIAHTQLGVKKKTVGIKRELILLLRIKVKGHFIVETQYRGKPKLKLYFVNSTTLRNVKQTYYVIVRSFPSPTPQRMPFIIMKELFWKYDSSNRSSGKIIFFLSFILLLQACSKTKVRLWNMNVLLPIFMTTRCSGYYSENRVTQRDDEEKFANVKRNWQLTSLWL